MFQIIQESLCRQDKALFLLRDLLEEEYEVLLGRDTSAVVSLEFSIQELIRQIAQEKSFVIRTLDGHKVMEYAETLSPEQGAVLRQLFQSVDNGEQGVSRQASRNAQLSLALLDQSTNTLKVLKSQVTPVAPVYSRTGDMRQITHPQAALISGRL